MLYAMNYEVKRTKSVFYISFPDTNEKAFLKYHVQGDRMYLDATYTPPQYRGKGIGRILVEAAIRYAEENGLKIVPVCSYAIYYFVKHPEKRKLLAPEYQNTNLEELLRKALEEEKKRGHS